MFKNILFLIFIGLVSCKKETQFLPTIQDNFGKGPVFHLIANSVNNNYLYKDYKKTSYELSKSGILNQSIPYVYDYSSFDYDGDGDNDVVISDENEIQTLVAHKVLYRNNNGTYTKEEFNNIPKVYFGMKPLIGDFNGDNLPDLFSLSAIDPPKKNNPLGLPNEVVYTPNYLILNSKSGFNQVKEFTDYKAYWHCGASGDIDKDGDLDIVIFNYSYNDVKIPNQIMWNDGKGNFTFDSRSIENLYPVDRCELVDVDNDGFLDLVVNNVAKANNIGEYYNDLKILYGNGKTFKSSNSTSIKLPSDENTLDDNKDFILTINLEDYNSDGFRDIIISSTTNSNGDWRIQVFKSLNGKNFVNETEKYFKDISPNILIYSPYPKDNIKITKL